MKNAGEAHRPVRRFYERLEAQRLPEASIQHRCKRFGIVYLTNPYFERILEAWKPTFLLPSFRMKTKLVSS
jgi:hypothetical protein